MIQGSCMCGQVSYTIEEKISDIIHCHCITCRKAHGSAFSSVASIPVAEFHLTRSDNLNSYESSPGKHRFFCKTCGTQVYAKRDNLENVILRLGSLDTGIPTKAIAHTWVSEKADWYDLDEELPQYDEGYPRR